MRRVNRLLVGAPGVGKTETVMQQYGHTEVLLLSSSVEEDIAGLPYREGEDECRTVPPFLKRLREAEATGKTTCLFLDELDKARREVADTLLTLVATRTTPYGLRLPENTEIVAACNPAEYGGGDGISAPMLNRFSVRTFEVDPERWGIWANNTFKSQEATELIKLFVDGTLPLLAQQGEGLESRLVSPRSVAYALQTLEAGMSGALGVTEACEDIAGLLPAAVSAHFITKFDRGDESLVDKATAVIRSMVSTGHQGPIRMGRGEK